ncbi:MAG: PEP/pyruvate-binding domain-containing protein [Syntrophales bacterium]|nr:PEP/pyruvate-binding domain-containing protein [Syntrophales bacterium]MDD5641431.1 PEP/pyruvate-binding domain-containing protein [Syntrophales bacterium]
MLAALQKLWKKVFKPPEELITFPELFEHFQALLQDHQKVMEIIADLGEKSGGDYVFDRKYLQDSVNELHVLLLHLIKGLNLISSNRYPDLYTTLDRIFLPIDAELRGRLSLAAEMPYVVGLEDLPVDHPELTGGKAANLGEISQRLHLPVPPGFIITTRAFRYFLEQNQLEDRIHALISAWLGREADTLQTSRQLQYGLLAGVVPQEVGREIRRRTEAAPFWAVRSSAHGEDGELSFAGLHESLLQVPARGVPEAYKKILASLFSPEALSYRRQMDMLGEEAAMAVLCQEVIASRASGVVHTLNLEAPETECLTVYAYPGLGRPVMDGRAQPDRLVVERQAPHHIRSREVFPKEYVVRPAPGGGEEEVTPAPEERDLPAISDATAQTLARLAISLERYFKRPQEIEWALDQTGQVWILQSRALAFSQISDFPPVEVADLRERYSLLLQDQGVVAHAGVGAGPVWVVESDADLEQFPEGAVLVTRYTAPWLARVVPKAAAIIAERGSPAGHLATIAREFRVPTLVGVEKATGVLTPGTEVTVDTNNRLVYAGRVQELLHYELLEATSFEDASEFRQLRRLLKRVAPLHLIDPQAPDFTPEGCLSVHDVIRFVHEKAVQELMDLPRFLKRFKGAQLWTLVSEVPMGLKIWDLGGGIDPAAQGGEVTAAQIRSLPLKTLWEGVCAPGVWSTEPIQVDFSGLMSSLTRTTEAATAAGFNLAVITGTYLNLHLRLGYHFNLVDARMDADPHHNHIYFRFVGGVTDLTRRSRRARLLADILAKYHFKVDIKGDLVIAKILHLPQEEIRRRLLVLGHLIGFTRQLDMQLKSDEDVPAYLAKFLERLQPLVDLEGS